MIYFVRHGETAWNVERRLQGRRDSPLTPRGERQALAMAELLAELISREAVADWRLISSPLGRALATAKPIAARLGLEVEIDARLAEMDFGDWEGRLHQEIVPQHPEMAAGRQWMASPPGGESFEAAWSRAAEFLANQPPEPRRRTIAVGHGMLGRFLNGCYGGLSREATMAMAMPHGAVYRLSEGQVDRFDCEPEDA